MHRDPETGQFLATDDDEPVELTYADHEFVNFRLTPSFTRDVGDDAERGVEYKIEDDVLDLENDELGMLSWMNASLSAYVSNFDVASSTRGGATVLGEIGANLAGEEFVSQAETARGVQVTDDVPSVNSGGNVANDEPGMWGTLNVAVNSGYNDETTGGPFSGNSVPGNDRIRRVFYEETSAGPYIDSTDDITVAVYVDKDNANSLIDVEVIAQLSFVVFEYENRRAEFAPYDPGPSME